jgi:hypothetical protein
VFNYVSRLFTYKETTDFYDWYDLYKSFVNWRITSLQRGLDLTSTTTTHPSDWLIGHIKRMWLVSGALMVVEVQLAFSQSSRGLGLVVVCRDNKL